MKYEFDLSFNDVKINIFPLDNNTYKYSVRSVNIITCTINYLRQTNKKKKPKKARRF